MTHLRMEGVAKRFGQTVALAHLDLDVDAGELIALLGPSGCGKTTALRVVAGFEHPDTGRVRVDGADVTRLPPNKRTMGMVFQAYSLFPHLDVRENVAFGLRMRRWTGARRAGRVEEMLELVGLGDRARHFPHQLSGGQQQRVALARALAVEPSILLLDEPLSALDAKVRVQLRGEIRRIQRDVGITTLFVTHDQEEALTMSDRIAVMSQGKVLQVGSPTEIYERPTCRFVADFIGETNFIEGKVTESGGGYAVIETPEGVRLRGTVPQNIALGTLATLSIRPEKAILMTPSDERATGAFALPVRVERVNYIGSDTRITVRLNEKRSLNVWEQNTRSTVDRDAYWQPGESALLVCPAENALVLTE